MNASAALPRPSIFPATSVEAKLRSELLASVRAAAPTLGLSIPVNDAAASSMILELDSLVVVETLCALDEILPFEVGESVVRSGGYESIDEALSDLLPRLSDEWNKHLGTKP